MSNYHPQYLMYDRSAPVNDPRRMLMEGFNRTFWRQLHASRITSNMLNRGREEDAAFVAGGRNHHAYGGRPHTMASINSANWIDYNNRLERNGRRDSGYVP